MQSTQSPAPNLDLSRFGTGLVGAACAMIGALVLAGWYADIPGLVRLLPGMPEMQAATALGLFAAGCGLLGGAGAPWLRRAFALAVLGTGLSALAAFLFHAPPYVNQILTVKPIDGGAIEPRLMAPNSAVALCFVGIGLLVLGGARTTVAAVTIAVVAVGVGGLAGQDIVRFAGEAVGFWGSTDRQMSLHAAAALLGVAIALRLEAQRIVPSEVGVPTRRALLVGTIALGAALVAGHLVRSHQRATVRTTTRTVGELLARELEAAAANGDVSIADLTVAAPGYLFEIDADGEQLRAGESGDETAAFGARIPIRAGGARATLHIRPSPALLEQSRRPLALAVLVMGSALALLLAVSVQAGETAKWRAKRLEAALTSLTAAELERRRAERALAQSQSRLHESRKMAAIARLAGGMAHEFNNMLSVIRGYTQLLAASSVEAERRSFAAEIDRASQRGAELTRRLLTVSARHVFHPQVFDLGAKVRALTPRIAGALNENIQLRIETEGIGDARVNVDPDLLEEVLVTLATSERDAMHGGGAFEIFVKRRTFEAGVAEAQGVQAGPFVELQVSDQRVMAPDELGRIFEPFGALPAGDDDGLALAMLYGFVRQCGGAVYVTSSAEQGTSFRMLFPGVQEWPKPVRAEMPTHATARPGTILVVEDEDALRRLVVRLLERSGYQVVAARNGVDALRHAALAPDPIELVLTDVVMREMGGAELAAALRDARPNLPVLFMSGYTNAEVAAGPVALPADAAFIQKPFSTTELLERVASLIAPESGDRPGSIMRVLRSATQ
ncbi:MAG: response regulator [Longimicrobiales bacterium]